MQGGLHVARCVRRDLAGKPRRPYRYHDLGSAAYIRRGDALLQVHRVRVSGFAGWLAWGFIHIAFLTGMRNRVSTVITWMATIARASRYHRAFMLGDPTKIEQERYTWSRWIRSHRRPRRGRRRPSSRVPDLFVCAHVANCAKTGANTDHRGLAQSHTCWQLTGSIRQHLARRTRWRPLIAN